VDDTDIRRSVGILTESPGLYERLSAYRNLAIFASLYDVEDVDRQVSKYLHMLGLWSRRDQPAGSFSKGMRQKLAIARALYKGGNCVIMDEPTSALDALAEAEIYSEFDTLTHGKTSIYISHRLASTKFCDKIALIDGSGLREYGSHDELMARGGAYHDMFVTQGKYYQEGGNAGCKIQKKSRLCLDLSGVSVLPISFFCSSTPSLIPVRFWAMSFSQNI
jgi:ABC-type multidrug transport system ATPase subunit